METFLFALNAILPLILLIALGFLFKKIKLFSQEFLAKANKVCFVVLLPVLLFHNTYSINSLSDINWIFILYGVLALIVIFAVSIGVVMLVEKQASRRGVLLQCMFRSNYAIIGIPLATSLFGVEGGAAASLLSAFTIPVFNILAVISLSMFNTKSNDVELQQATQQDGLPTQQVDNSVEKPKRIMVLSILKGVVTNPLIIAVFSGLLVLAIRQLFVTWNIEFRLYDLSWFKASVDYIGRTATPIALLVLGGRFEFSAVKKLAKEIVIGVVGRCVVVPFVGLLVACILFPNFNGGQYASYIALFCTPVAVSSAIMAKEMNGDSELAGQLVVWTTIFSSVTIVIAIMALRALGLLGGV